MAFSKSFAKRSRSAVTSASRASATANRTSVSGVSVGVSTADLGVSADIDRSMPTIFRIGMPVQSERASTVICQLFALSRKAASSPELMARIMVVRPRLVRAAALPGERCPRGCPWSMTGQ